MGWLPGGPGPGHELVEARSRPEIDQAGEHVGEVGLRVDAAQFAGFDERGDAGPVLGALIVTGEERLSAAAKGFRLGNQSNAPKATAAGRAVRVAEAASNVLPIVNSVRASGVSDLRGDR